MKGIAQRLAEMVLDTAGEDIPMSSNNAAVKMLLDTIGCAYAGRYTPGIDELLDLECQLSAPGNGTVFLDGRRLALPSAAFCNAAMIHAMDFDNNSNADIHILSIVVPVAFACAEDTSGGGRECLAAIILGVEAATRIAKPYVRAKRRHNYFLTTSLVGGWAGLPPRHACWDCQLSRPCMPWGSTTPTPAETARPCWNEP